jgi:hypothetical protein
MNKKILLTLLVVLTIFIGAQAVPIVSVKKLFAIGHGFAINTQDPYDFHVFVIGVGEVNVNNTDIKVGIIRYDGTNYLLSNIVLENGSFSATITTMNRTEIGSINLTKFYRDNLEIWAGTAIVNDVNYNVYVSGIRRDLTDNERAYAIGEYCKKYPQDERCKGLGQNYACNVSAENCREKIIGYCRDHPSDDRCKHLVYRYCMENKDDLRCREAFEKFCTANPTNVLCRNIVIDYCRTHTNDTRCRDLAVDYCKNHPWDEKCYRAAYKYCQANPNETICSTIRTMAINYCRDHPKDWRCIEIAKRYCSANPSDENCLNALKNYCEDNPNHPACIAAKVTYCNLNPTDARCT